MEIASVAGIGVATVAILMGMAGNLGAFIDIPSFLITVVGSLGVTFASFVMEDFKKLPKVIGKAFKKPEDDPLEVMNVILELANKARKEGMMALESEIPNIKDPLIKRGVETMMMGVDVDVLKEVLETEVEQMEERHKAGKKMLDQWAYFGPAFGMIGTLVGLIIMLGQLSDPSSLGPAMAVAMITTLYGAIIANVFAGPIAAKLEELSKKEITCKNMIVIGLVSLASGESPAAIESKLKPYLDPEVRATLEEGQEE